MICFKKFLYGLNRTILKNIQNQRSSYNSTFHMLSIKGVSISLKLFPSLWVDRGQMNCQIINWSSYLSNAIRTREKGITTLRTYQY